MNERINIMSVITLDFTKSSIINVEALKQNNRRLATGLISSANEIVEDDTVTEHSAEPIKNIEDIDRICDYLISNNRYRDYMLFVIGVNFGLRVSDLRVLRFSNLINDNFTFKNSFPIFEQKTRNTRKHKKNRYITINDAVIEAVTLYLENTPNVSLSDYMFRSESNRGGASNQPLSRQSVDRILKEIASELDLNIRFSTHSLRKTFCYHQMLMSHNDNRKLLLLQKMLNHSSPAQTLDYIGITEEEIDEAYRNLNLGSKNHSYFINSKIVEFEACI
jgi:integrase